MGKVSLLCCLEFLQIAMDEGRSGQSPSVCLDKAWQALEPSYEQGAGPGGFGGQREDHVVVERHNPNIRPQS